MRKRNESTTMSVSTRTSITQIGSLSYTEAPIPVIHLKQRQIPRLYPVLAEEGVINLDENKEGLPPFRGVISTSSGPLAPKKEQIRGVLNKYSNHSSNAEYILKWKGLTGKEIENSLIPVKIHYKVQLLFLEERRERSLIMNEHLTKWVEIQIQFREESPLRQKLLTWGTVNALSQRMQILHQRNQQSSKIISMASIYNIHTMKDDLLHTPSTHIGSSDQTPFTGDSQVTYIIPKQATAPSESLTNIDYVVSEISLERSLLEKTQNQYSSPRRSVTLSGNTIPTVSRVLNGAEEMISTDNHEKSPKKGTSSNNITKSALDNSPNDDNDDDSLERSLISEAARGEQVRLNFDDSLERSLISETARGEQVRLNFDDSLERSLISETARREQVRLNFDDSLERSLVSETARREQVRRNLNDSLERSLLSETQCGKDLTGNLNDSLKTSPSFKTAIGFDTTSGGDDSLVRSLATCTPPNLTNHSEENQ